MMLIIMVVKRKTHLTVKWNPVEIHGAGDLHSGKDVFKSLEAKKNYNYSL